MKILYFGGGLGNQIFEYAFYIYLKKTIPQEHIYGLYRRNCFSEHNGLELSKWFNAEFPSSRWFVKPYALIVFVLKKMGIHRFIDRDNSEWKNKKAPLVYPLKYNRLYIPETEWITWKIEDAFLIGRNRDILDKISKTHSFFIHVRRGDYLSPQYRERFAGTCPLSYYESAIQDIKNQNKDVCFFVFSDDINWARENLPLKSAEYIDWNIGENSPIDMYLMSQCEGGVIANSTFSFWGAILGKKKTIVYYPKNWFNGESAPNIFPVEWKSF